MHVSADFQDWVAPGEIRYCSCGEYLVDPEDRRGQGESAGDRICEVGGNASDREPRRAKFFYCKGISAFASRVEPQWRSVRESTCAAVCKTRHLRL